MAKAKKTGPAEPEGVNENTDNVNANFYTVACERGLNLRDAPDGKIIVILPQGHELMCFADAGELPEWVEVDAGDGVSGWVMSKYLKEVP